MIAAEEKTRVISEYRRHEKDAGSPEIQVAILTSRIATLTEHLKQHKHDYSSRRGLVMLVGKRTRLLRYLQTVNREGYLNLIKRLGLRK